MPHLRPPHRPRSSRRRVLYKVRLLVRSRTTFDTIKKMLETEYLLSNRFASRRSSTTAMPPWSRPSSKALPRTVVRSTHRMLTSHRFPNNRGNILAGARFRGARSHLNLSDKANARSTLSNPSSVSIDRPLQFDTRTQAKDIAHMKTLQHRWWRSYGRSQLCLARAREAADVAFSP